MKNYVKFNLTDLPMQKFVVLLKSRVQEKLIVDALDEIAKRTKNWGKYKRLAIYLHGRCESLKDIKLDYLWNSYIFDWQNSKKYIPVDCILELCKLIGKDLKEEDILFVKYRISHNDNGIRFPFIYDEDLAYLSEAVRMEGHIKKNLTQVNISNKNLVFLKKFEKIVKEYVPGKSIYKNITVEIDIPKDKDVKEVRNKERKINFDIYKASRSNKLKLRFYDKFDKLESKYEIILSDNSIIHVENKELNGEFISQSTYKISSAVLNLSVCNMTFAMLLNLFFEIQKGKKSDIIYVANCLKNSPLSVKREAINAILDSEAWIQNSRIRVGLNSRQYLKDLKNLFRDFGINPNLEIKKSTLSINNVKELKKISEFFKFSLDRKNEQLRGVTKNKSSLKWGEGLTLVLNILKNNEGLTNREISNYRKKHFDTIHQQLLKCLKNGFAERNTDVWPYRYFITDKGLKILNSGGEI